MKNYYTKKVIQHFTKPKNFGQIKNADGIGKVGNPACGDVLTLYLKIDKKREGEVIQNIKFQTLGCPAAVAVSDMVCDLVKGKKLEQAYKINNQEIVKKLGGLPPIKIHCSLLAEQALKSAIKDYESKKENNKKEKSDCGDEWRCGFKCGGCSA